MRFPKAAICFLFLFVISGCGEEQYSTPQKTLEKFVANRTMGTATEIDKVLNCFTKKNQEWWKKNYIRACQLKYGTFNALCGGGTINQSNIWSALTEEVSPKTAEVEDSKIDEKDGSAVLVVQGQKVYFVKERGNWKIDGFFGVDDELKRDYPELQ